jgi:hypothetical protein
LKISASTFARIKHPLLFLSTNMTSASLMHFVGIEWGVYYGEKYVQQLLPFPASKAEN